MAAARKPATAKEPPAAKAPAAKAPVAKAVTAVVASARPAAPRKAKAAPAAKPGKAAKPVKAEKAAKADKARKPKMVRDSFTIPKAEYTVLQSLKDRAARLGRPSKKSEVLRAGIKALEAMSDEAFTACLGLVPTIKTGRPAKQAAAA